MEQVGKYKVLSELGRGGFGAVYLCKDTLGQRVAVKVFDPKDDVVAGMATSATGDAGEVLKQRFTAEAKTLRRLSSNPYIVDLYDFDETEEGIAYYVMPYLEHSLVDEIGKDVFSAGALEELEPDLRPRKIPVALTIRVLTEILEGMKTVHREGLVHRDLKPTNILFDKPGPEGKVQVCDFGIAKLPDADHSQSGVGMGSRNYVSPEQRESAKHVDATSDVYAIGVMVYRMLTGTLPIGRFDDPILYAPAIGQPLNDLIIHAMSAEPNNRPKDAGEFLKSLKTALKSLDASQPEDEETGTWIDQGGSSLRDELKPLRDQLEKLLLAHGEIPYEERDTLQAVAIVADLDTAGFDALVAQVEETLSQQLKPIKNYLGLVDVRLAKADFGAQDKRALYAAGAAIGWGPAKVDSVISARLPKHNDDEPDHLRSDETSGWVWVAVVVVLLLVAGGWWIGEQQQQQAEQERIAAEQRAERTRQEAEAWVKAESINTVAAYESYQSQSFATVSHKQVATNRIDILKAESLWRTEEIRVARIAADKRAKEKAEAAEKVRVARIAADKRAKEKAERERLEKLRLAKLVAESSPGCVSGNCVSGFGIKEYLNGSRYEGNFKDGKRSGQSTYYWKNGNRYEGNHKDGKRSGQGTYYVNNGDRYEGNWKDGLKSGHGTFYFKDGDRYEGNWKDGLKSGQGTFYFKDGDRYEGNWKDSKQSGRGTHYFENGNRYEGNHKDGKQSGQGTFYFKDGSQEKQNWRDGKNVQ